MDDLFLIPTPQQWLRGKGTYQVSFENAAIYVPSSAASEELSALRKKAAEIFGSVDLCPGRQVFSLFTGTDSAPASTYTDTLLCDYYELRVSDCGISLHAPTAAGFFYGLITIARLNRDYLGKIPCGTIRDWADTPLRAEYMDLRYLFPRKDLFAPYIREMAENKVNALIIEFENRRPFNTYPAFSDPEYAFSADELAALSDCARENFIDLIPLQQSFGHLEYALCKPEFKCLRETPDALGELCPEKEGSYQLAALLLEETAALFPSSHYLHLGCDEVWSLGEGDESKASGKTRAALFIDFVNRLAEHVSALGKKPLIWHDMLKTATDAELDRLDRRITVIVWVYGSPRDLEASRSLMERFRAHGIPFWAACSVRCWDGDGLQVFPLADNRFRNVDAWAEYMKEFSIPGMVNTNWAVPFALGGPYGLYETSLFTGTYADESCWNLANHRETFVQRYLRSYHGLWECDKYRLLLPSEYYRMADCFLPESTRHREVLTLFSLLSRYEVLTRQHGPLHTFLYRLDDHDDASLEKLSQRYHLLKEGLDALRESFRNILCQFLPETMADTYLRCRYYLPELYLTTFEEEIKRRSL